MKGTLKQHRCFLGITQEEMAQRCGVSRQTYIVWESNPGGLTFEKGIMLANLLGVDFNDIIFVPEQAPEMTEVRS